MRLAVCALSAVLLSGCSWLGGMGNLVGGHGANYGQTAHYGGQYGQGSMAGGQHNPCVVYSPQAPIPRGCDPASVTIGAASGGFPQQPNFGGGNFASGGFGSHAGVAGQQAANYQPRKRMRKPKLRGTMSLGLEKSISGNLLDYGNFPTLTPGLGYNPAIGNESIEEGGRASGQEVDTLYSAVVEGSSTPSISFDDVHSTPLSLKGGVEYIYSPRTTIFANAGYAHSEGNSGRAISINGELRRDVTTRNYVTEDGPPQTYTLTNTLNNGAFVPNQTLANLAYDFSDQRRVELEVGGRHYFNPVVKNQGFKTLTPFVGASVGAIHHNAVSFNITQDQLFYQRAFESGGETAEYYQVGGASAPVELYDSQWVPAGQLNAGVEWQLTPKTALAFESGLKIEGAREYSNGTKGDNNIAIPFTVRGSYNF